MDGSRWVKLFIDSLFERRAKANDKKCYDSNSLWTEFMVKEVMKKTMAKKLNCKVTCRDQGDKKISGEYLNIDAMFFNKSDYENSDYKKSKTVYDPRVLPVAVVEHENEGSGKDKIAHCLWKLLCICSQLRVLICYHKNIELLRAFLENTIRAGKLAKGLAGDLFVIIGDSSEDDVPWEKKGAIKNYFNIFKWKNNRLEKFTDYL